MTVITNLHQYTTTVRELLPFSRQRNVTLLRCQLTPP